MQIGACKIAFILRIILLISKMNSIVVRYDENDFGEYQTSTYSRNGTIKTVFDRERAEERSDLNFGDWIVFRILCNPLHIGRIVQTGKKTKAIVLGAEDDFGYKHKRGTVCDVDLCLVVLCKSDGPHRLECRHNEKEERPLECASVDELKQHLKERAQSLKCEKCCKKSLFVKRDECFYKVKKCERNLMCEKVSHKMLECEEINVLGLTKITTFIQCSSSPATSEEVDNYILFKKEELKTNARVHTSKFPDGISSFSKFERLYRNYYPRKERYMLDDRKADAKLLWKHYGEFQVSKSLRNLGT